MSATPTVVEVKEIGEFVLVSDALVADRIADALEEVQGKIAAQVELDPDFSISDRRQWQLIGYRACSLLALTERKLQAESGDGLSGTYEGTEGRFRREFERAWSRALGGVNAFTAGSQI